MDHEPLPGEIIVWQHGDPRHPCGHVEVLTGAQARAMNRMYRAWIRDLKRQRWAARWQLARIVVRRWWWKL